MERQEEIIHKEPAPARKGSKQGRVKRTHGGEPLLKRDSIVVKAETTGSPEIAKSREAFARRLAERAESKRAFRPYEGS